MRCAKRVVLHTGGARRGRVKGGEWTEEGLEVAVEAAPEVLADTGERRPDDFAGIVAKVGESTTVLAEETPEDRLFFAAAVAGVEHAEIAHPEHIVDEPGAAFHVGLAEEILVLEPEVVLEGEH